MKPTQRRTHRTVLAAVAAALAITTVAACGDDKGKGPEVTETVFVTGKQSNSTSSAPVTSEAPVTGSGADALKKGFAAVKGTFGAPVGIAVAPVGGGPVITLGDQSPQVAWSTIKVPLALAAERKNGPSASETAAIVNSDNAGAESLWASLGTPEEASAAVTAVLREGGDQQSVVPSVRQRPEYTIFGQTVWTLKNAATFTSNLPCLPGSKRVVSLMGQVAGNQQWGVESIQGYTTAVKGGWGPSVQGGYVVRQLALLTQKNGKRTAITMSTYAPGATMDSGIAALNRAGAWLAKNVAKLPNGDCA
ncbi:MAG: hypothetical protein QM658_15695 [Gordonia sp. (in: high G+C Gram-positive bacteria)]